MPSNVREDTTFWYLTLQIIVGEVKACEVGKIGKEPWNITRQMVRG
jgi:hypothetical protein